MFSPRPRTATTGFTKTNYRDAEERHGLHFLRGPLQCDQLGVSVIDVADGREGPVHDHADDGQEEVYPLLEGAAALTVADDPVELAPGGAVRIAPETTREQVLHGDSLLVAAAAP